MSKDIFKKMKSLQAKIERLKIEQGKIQQDLVAALGQMLEIKNAFRIDFDVLMGGFVYVIDAVEFNPSLTEEWQQVGKGLRNLAIKSRQRKVFKIASERV